MIGIVPVPTFTSLVVVCKIPLKPLNVGLLELLYKLTNVIWISYNELICVVAHLPSILTEFYVVNVLFNFLLLLQLCDSLCFFHHKIVCEFVFLSDWYVLSVQSLFQLWLRLSALLLFHFFQYFWINKTKLTRVRYLVLVGIVRQDLISSALLDFFLSLRLLLVDF